MVSWETRDNLSVMILAEKDDSMLWEREMKPSITDGF